MIRNYSKFKTYEANILNALKDVTIGNIALRKLTGPTISSNIVTAPPFYITIPSSNNQTMQQLLQKINASSYVAPPLPNVAPSTSYVAPPPPNVTVPTSSGNVMIPDPSGNDINFQELFFPGDTNIFDSNTIIFLLQAFVEDCISDLRKELWSAFQTHTQKELCVRIFPNEISLDYLTDSLTEAEIDDGKKFWVQWYIASGSKRSEYEAWQILCDKYPPYRAAWIVRRLKPINYKKYRKGNVWFYRRPYQGMEASQTACEHIYRNLAAITLDERKTKNEATGEYLNEILIRKHIDIIKENLFQIDRDVMHCEFIVDYLFDNITATVNYLKRRLRSFIRFYEKFPGLYGDNVRQMELWDVDYTMLKTFKNETDSFSERLKTKRITLQEMIAKYRKEPKHMNGFFPTVSVNTSGKPDVPVSHSMPDRFLFMGEVEKDEVVVVDPGNYYIYQFPVKQVLDSQLAEVLGNTTVSELIEILKNIKDFQCERTKLMDVISKLDILKINIELRQSTIIQLVEISYVLSTVNETDSKSILKAQELLREKLNEMYDFLQDILSGRCTVGGISTNVTLSNESCQQVTDTRSLILTTLNSMNTHIPHYVAIHPKILTLCPRTASIASRVTISLLIEILQNPIFQKPIYKTLEPKKITHYGKRVKRNLQMGFNINEDPETEPAKITDKGDLDISGGMAWLVDYDKAEDAGMAITVPIENSENAFKYIYVMGICDSKNKEKDILESLFNSHNYTPAGFEMLSPATPTNIVEGGKPAYDSDPEEEMKYRYEAEVEEIYNTSKYLSYYGEAFNDSGVLSHSLKLSYPNCFGRVKNFDHIHDLNTKIAYQVLWERFTKKIEAPVLKEKLDILGWFLTEYVRASGTIPAFRIGEQPYGITHAVDSMKISNFFDQLIVSYQNDIKDSKNDSQSQIYLSRFTFLRDLYKTLIDFADQWKTIRKNEVIDSETLTRGNPAENFLNMAGLTPYSIAHTKRWMLETPMLPKRDVKIPEAFNLLEECGYFGNVIVDEAKKELSFTDLPISLILNLKNTTPIVPLTL